MKDTDSSVLQENLDSLQSWSDIWQLKFNADKCKVMHIGHSFDTKYYMGDASTTKELKAVKEERDLGMIITSDLQKYGHCGLQNYLQGIHHTTLGVLYSSLVATFPQGY